LLLEEKAQLQADIAQHRKDRDSAKDSMADATELRTKESSAFTAEEEQSKTDFDSLKTKTDETVKTKGGEQTEKESAIETTKDDIVASKDGVKDATNLLDGALKELENLKQQIIERKSILKEQGMSGGQQNKDEEVVKMVNRMNELKEKQDPGSTKKDPKKDAKKKTPLSQEEQKEYSKLQGEVELYKNKLRTEFGYSNKDMKADPDLAEMEAKLAAFEKRGA